MLESGFIKRIIRPRDVIAPIACEKKLDSFNEVVIISMGTTRKSTIMSALYNYIIDCPSYLQAEGYA